MASASSASTAGSTEVIAVEGHQELEKACGFRYRREFTDLGLGFARSEMQQTLRLWGFEVSRTACDRWLKRYRLGEGGVDGSAALYLRSRQDLQRWYHVEGLTRSKLVDRYRAETGVFANSENLERWLKAPAQALVSLQNNEDVHTHACGEFVLDQLQNGVTAEQVVQQLLDQYLIKTTPQRCLAYRMYREQRGEYWTMEKLERLHWQFLYAQVNLEKSLAAGGNHRKVHLRNTRDLTTVRVILCEAIHVAEEYIPLRSLSCFYVRHEPQARLALEFPEAVVHTDRVSAFAVEVYRKNFRGFDLYDTAHQQLSDEDYRPHVLRALCSIQTRSLCGPGPAQMPAWLQPIVWPSVQRSIQVFAGPIATSP